MRSLAIPLLLLLLLFQLLSPTLALDFLFNSFSNISNATDLTLINDAKLDATAVRLTNDTVQYSLGRLFHTTKLTMRPNSTSTSLTSFSTSFVFSVLPQIATSPGFGLSFFLSNSTSPPNALASSTSASSPTPPAPSSRRYSPSTSTPAETPSSTTPTETTSVLTSTTSNRQSPHLPGTSTRPAASFRFRCGALRTSGLGSNSAYSEL